MTKQHREIMRNELNLYILAIKTPRARHLSLTHYIYVMLLQRKKPLQLKEKSLVKINKSFVLMSESKAVLYLYDTRNFLSQLHITNETL